MLQQPEDVETLATPLHVAAEGGRPMAVLALLMGGADPGASDVRGRNAYVDD